ncbi:hypothetical protein QBC34DRAFT_224265 [Podospora aff. communis PSN243]|uniref:NACHT domain-containing protein n=1 Tax=Podospora aff. communis PSN243 TaxID=3040156 RepID=A0AAV9G435_9PEZI|nr:hypothetical protein QBC34DRAFT_224265 [Podospora aff. communis PSN243]
MMPQAPTKLSGAVSFLRPSSQQLKGSDITLPSLHFDEVPVTEAIMETLAALGLAANILQFLQVTTTFVTQARDIYRSGPAALGKFNDLRDISRDLHKMLVEMQRQNATPRTEVNETSLALQKDCMAVLQDLTRSLDSLGLSNANPGKREALATAFRAMWKRAKIDELEQRIMNFRQQLVLGLVVTLRQFAVQSLDRQDEILRRLDRPNIARSGAAPADAILGHVVQQLKAPDQTTTLNSQLRTMALRQVQFPGKGDGVLSQSIQVPQWRGQQLEEKFLASISFQEMRDRQSQISQAHEKTFRWIFHDTPGQQWSSFVSWLGSASQALYWITGKAGSGKSTLMKFIAHSVELRRRLRSGYNSSGPVLTASFYFWANGTAMEASQEGLYKSLLYQLLDGNRDLIPLVVPKAWELLCLFGDLKGHRSPSKEDLHRMLVATVGQLSQRARVFILIDGLDEFSGDADQLLDTVQELLAYPIKICVASRPWVVFEDAFHNKPQLLLQQLTRNDIRTYVDSRLDANRGFLRLRARDPEFAMELAADIVDKAQGVFLWVRVVVDSLLVGLRHDDRILDLQKRLDQLPPDIESLYDRVLSMWDPFYFKHAAEYFQLMFACLQPPPAPVFFYSDAVENGDVRRALLSTKAWSVDLLSTVEPIRRRLNSRCLGLLEVKEREPAWTYGRGSSDKTETFGTRIDYLHRTVKDYVARADVQRRFRDATGTFDANLQLCFAWMAYAITERNVSARRGDGLSILKCVMHASKASDKSSAEVVQILNNLQRINRSASHRNYSPIDSTYRVRATSLDADEEFLSLAARVGVTHYVEAWIKQVQDDRELSEPWLVLRDLKTTPPQLLLQALLCPEPDAMMATVRLLDKAGALRDLNLRIEPKFWTLLARLVREFVVQCYGCVRGESMAAVHWKRWAPVLRLLFDRGAQLGRELLKKVFDGNMRADCDPELVVLMLEKLRLGKEEVAFQFFRTAFLDTEMVPSEVEYETDYESE